MERADKEYNDDFPISNIPEWINEFFQKYQPERPNPEDHIVTINNMICDGLNTTVM